MNLTLEQLKRAVEIKEQIEKLEKELKEILGDVEIAEAPKRTYRKRKRQMSPEARARIAAAQKARWQKAKQQQTSEQQAQS